MAAIDNWQIACDTFEKNLGLKPICAGVDEDSVNRALEASGPFDVIVGGPPCQGFSTSGKRALDDPRNSLVLAFLRAVEIARPVGFMMENVAGFKSFQGGDLFREVVARAEDLGYEVCSAVVQASHFGAPQRRRRFILVGTLGANLMSFGPDGSQETLEFLTGGLKHQDQTLDPGLEKWSFDDATSDLPPVAAGGSEHKYASRPKNALQQYYRRSNIDWLTEHKAMSHRPDFVRMMSFIPQGKSALDPEINLRIPENIRPGKGFPNSYARLRPDQPSPTITRNFTTPSSANCIHPHQDRALTLREGARLQTFPDSFEFMGSTEEKRLQIGNAVPPILGEALGARFLNALASASCFPKALS